MVDPDGRDAIVSITRNKDGSVMLKVQTVVHITGSTEPSRIKGYNKDIKERFKDQQVNVEGKVWNIQYDIQYVYDQAFDASKMKEGENVLKVTDKVAMTGSNRTHVGPETNQGLIALGHRKYPEVISHETGHLIGFNDQYTEVSGDYTGFKDYLRSKYNSKEDLAPGGTVYKMVQAARDGGLSISVPNIGYENNEMQNNKGGFTDDQNKALINKALGVSGGKDGSFLIQGIFDAKGTPAQENLQKAYETLEKRIQQTTSKDTKKTD